MSTEHRRLSSADVCSTLFALYRALWHNTSMHFIQISVALCKNIKTIDVYRTPSAVVSRRVFHFVRFVRSSLARQYYDAFDIDIGSAVKKKHVFHFVHFVHSSLARHYYDAFFIDIGSAVKKHRNNRCLQNTVGCRRPTCVPLCSLCTQLFGTTLLQYISYRYRQRCRQPTCVSLCSLCTQLFSTTLLRCISYRYPQRCEKTSKQQTSTEHRRLSSADVCSTLFALYAALWHDNTTMHFIQISVVL